ncbi:hypothetical protein D3C71_2018810 [compost metagenome]
MVGAQLGQALAQARQQSVGGMVVDPDLGGDEQFVARYTGFGDCLADLGFIAVDLRGVDGAIAELEGVAH